MLNTKLTISGFCDEIHDFNKIQFDVLKELGINHYDFRLINAKNPLDFSDETIDAVLDMGKEYGMTVTSIGSFIGKIKTDGNFDVHFEQFKRIVEIAKKAGTKYIRIFSFYLPENEDFDSYEDFVVEKLVTYVKYAEEHDVILLHENEKGIYGNVASRCKRLFERIVSPNFRCAFDFSNFVECGQDCMEAYEMLKSYIEQIHIKDNKGGHTVVPAGHGDGQIPEIISDIYKYGYRGVVSMEPHLYAQYQIPDDAEEWVTGLDTGKKRSYAYAVQAIKKILDSIEE